MDKNWDADENLETTEAAEAAQEESNPFFGSADEIVSRYTRCPMCASNLHFNHSTDFSRNLTLETSKCPECAIQIRKLMHRLH